MILNTTEKKIFTTQNFQSTSGVDISENSHFLEDKKGKTKMNKSDY